MLREVLSRIISFGSLCGPIGKAAYLSSIPHFEEPCPSIEDCKGASVLRSESSVTTTNLWVSRPC